MRKHIPTRRDLGADLVPTILDANVVVVPCPTTPDAFPEWMDTAVIDRI